MIKITDKRFRYTPSFNTDLRRKFRKVQAEIKAKAEQETLNAAEAQAKVEPLQKRRKAS